MDNVVLNITEQNETVVLNITEGPTGPPGQDALIEQTIYVRGTADQVITLPHNYEPGSVKVFKNGARLDDEDFTESAVNQITLMVSRIEDDRFTIDFKYRP